MWVDIEKAVENKLQNTLIIAVLLNSLAMTYAALKLFTLNNLWDIIWYYSAYPLFALEYFLLFVLFSRKVWEYKVYGQSIMTMPFSYIIAAILLYPFAPAYHVILLLSYLTVRKSNLVKKFTYIANIGSQTFFMACALSIHGITLLYSNNLYLALILSLFFSMPSLECLDALKLNSLWEDIVLRVAPNGIEFKRLKALIGAATI